MKNQYTNIPLEYQNLNIRNYQSIMNPASNHLNNKLLKSLVNITDEQEENIQNQSEGKKASSYQLVKSKGSDLTIAGRIKEKTIPPLDRQYNKDSYFAPWNKAKIGKEYTTNFEILVSKIPSYVKHDELSRLFQGVINIDYLESSTDKSLERSAILMFPSQNLADSYSRSKHIRLNTSNLEVQRVKSHRLIFIGNIDKSLNESNLKILIKEHVSKSGIRRIVNDLDEIQFLNDPLNRNHNRGFCFLKYSSTASALQCKNYLQDNLLLGNRPILVDWANEFHSEDHNLRQIHISGIHKGISTKELLDCFSSFGKIQNIKLARDLSSGGRLDYGFVTYETNGGAKAALEKFKWGDFFRSEIKISYARAMSAIIKHRENKEQAKRLLGNKRRTTDSLDARHYLHRLFLRSFRP